MQAEPEVWTTVLFNRLLAGPLDSFLNAIGKDVYKRQRLHDGGGCRESQHSGDLRFAQRRNYEGNYRAIRQEHGVGKCSARAGCTEARDTRRSEACSSEAARAVAPAVVASCE